MSDWNEDLAGPMRRHYERYPYPRYGLLGSVRARETYAFNLEAIWAFFNGERILPYREGGILLAGSGSFLPYPVSLANPRSRLVALDLSAPSLARARLHALRHLRFNVDYLAGDLMDAKTAPGPFRYIDSYGVLHCMPDFAAALRALEARLVPGGILRVMVYGRDGRADVERVRALCAERGIRRPREVRRLAREDGELARLLRESFELGSNEGVADAFLIPYDRTFVVDEVVDAIGETGLSLLRFAHRGALPRLDAELSRIRRLEKKRAFPTNLVFYLRKEKPVWKGRGEEWQKGAGARLELNPALKLSLLSPPLVPIRLPPRLGFDNPPIDLGAWTFLRRFARPADAASLSREEAERARPFIEAMILMEYEAK
jgi:SAM-dependent methyltransferase